MHGKEMMCICFLRGEGKVGEDTMPYEDPSKHIAILHISLQYLIPVFQGFNV